MVPWVRCSGDELRPGSTELRRAAANSARLRLSLDLLPLGSAIVVTALGVGIAAKAVLTYLS
jgi:hypothetical protein